MLHRFSNTLESVVGKVLSSSMYAANLQASPCSSVKAEVEFRLRLRKMMTVHAMIKNSVLPVKEGKLKLSNRQEFEFRTKQSIQPKTNQPTSQTKNQLELPSHILLLTQLLLSFL